MIIDMTFFHFGKVLRRECNAAHSYRSRLRKYLVSSTSILEKRREQEDAETFSGLICSAKKEFEMIFLICDIHKG